MKKLIILAVLLTTAHNMHAASSWNWRAYLPSAESVQNFGMTCRQWISENPKAAAVGSALVGLGGLGYLGYRSFGKTQTPADLNKPTSSVASDTSIPLAETTGPKKTGVAGIIASLTDKLTSAIQRQDTAAVENLAMRLFNFEVTVAHGAQEDPRATPFAKHDIAGNIASSLTPINQAISQLTDEKTRTEMSDIIDTAFKLAMQKYELMNAIRLGNVAPIAVIIGSFKDYRKHRLRNKAIEILVAAQTETNNSTDHTKRTIITEYIQDALTALTKE